MASWPEGVFEDPLRSDPGDVYHERVFPALKG